MAFVNAATSHVQLISLVFHSSLLELQLRDGVALRFEPPNDASTSASPLTSAIRTHSSCNAPAREAACCASCRVTFLYNYLLQLSWSAASPSASISPAASAINNSRRFFRSCIRSCCSSTVDRTAPSSPSCAFRSRSESTLCSCKWFSCARLWSFRRPICCLSCSAARASSPSALFRSATSLAPAHVHH